MANEQIIFKKGLSAAIPSTKVVEQILFETDTGVMNIDTSSSTRVQVKDSTKVDKKGIKNDLLRIITPRQILFTKDTGKLFKDTTQNNQNTRVPIQSAIAFCWQDWT